MSLIIDAHTHFTPPAMKENLEAFAEKEPYWGLLITPDEVNHTEQGWATPERMIEDMDKAGIDKAVILGVYRQTAEDARATNNDTLAIMRKYPDRVLGFGVMTPGPISQSLDEVRRCFDHGMMGIGELNPYGQGLTFDDPVFLKVVEAVIDAGKVLNLHVSEEVGHYYLGKSTTPMMEYYGLASRYPDLKLILAHWGGGLIFFEIVPDVRKTLRNVFYDTAGTPLIYPTGSIFNLALQACDPKKVLYGSDYPLLILPKKQKGPDFQPFLDEINEVGLSRDVYEDVMGMNAARLFGLVPPESQTESRKMAASGAPSKVITEIVHPESTTIEPYMAVTAVANTWPETRQVFEKYQIPWKNSPIPFWEPVAQAAAAHGYGPSARKKILDELNEVIRGK